MPLMVLGFGFFFLPPPPRNGLIYLVFHSLGFVAVVFTFKVVEKNSLLAV